MSREWVTLELLRAGKPFLLPGLFGQVQVDRAEEGYLARFTSLGGKTDQRRFSEPACAIRWAHHRVNGRPC